MSDAIRFVLNGAERSVSGLSPTMTVLQYLRLHERLTGTKEGCAEGDCGACTVLVGEATDGKIKYKSVNACIMFLPVLDGKAVVTVENLGGKHPVQDAMVACHGSQCGFCTPGFVMSLANLHHNNPKADREEIQDAIAGNLCRCTGYRPILDAAAQACGVKGDYLEDNAKILKPVQRTEMLSYEGGGGKFFAPRTLAEFADVYAQYPNATILAGGTDVGLWVTKKHKDLPVIIYTGHVCELLEVNEGREGLDIGAAVTYADAFSALAAYDDSLKTMLRRFASAQIRNQGTVGGNIANGSPIGDGPPALIALNAKLQLRSKTGTRVMDLEDFFLAYGKQDRKQGEFVEKILIPRKDKYTQFRVYKISKRFDQDISAVCGAFALTLRKGTIMDARIAFGGMAATPRRATATEIFLKGKGFTEDIIRQAMAKLDQDYTPLTDMRATAEYRKITARNLLLRYYLDVEGKTEQVYGYGL